MIIIEGIAIPTPFGGSIKTPNLETPPVKLPRMPDKRGMQAIGHGIGEDAAAIIGLIPWVGELAEDALQDCHDVEIKNILTVDEYREYSEYNKSLPSAVALARVFCFKEV